MAFVRCCRGRYRQLVNTARASFHRRASNYTSKLPVSKSDTLNLISTRKFVSTIPQALNSENTPAATDLGQTQQDAVTYDHVNANSTDKNMFFAVFEHGGKQYKVVEDDLLMLDYMGEANVGQEVVFDNIMLLASENHTVIGKPFIPGTKVCAVVEEQTQTRKIRVFKKRRRKASSKRTKGHRSMVTLVRITEINHGQHAT
eukprot:jgi/Bigna1/66429/fgenesh1_pg.1_\